MSFRLLQWFRCWGTVLCYFCSLHEPWQIDIIQIIHPLENLHCQTEWKRVDAVTRKRIEYIWNLWSNQYKVSRWLKPTLVEYTKKKEINEQRNETRASLHDFVVLNINRKLYASIASSSELPESREFKSSMTATLSYKIWKCACNSSYVIPKHIQIHKNQNQRGYKKRTLLCKCLRIFAE